MNRTDLVDRAQLRDDVPDFGPGDTLKVHVRVVEGNRERTQLFQGVVIRRQGSGARETFTVRKVRPPRSRKSGSHRVRRRGSGVADPGVHLRSNDEPDPLREQPGASRMSSQALAA